MTEQAPPGESPYLPDRAALHPEVFTWLNEARRLFEEAEERLESGAVLPALSSLAAVPPLHGMLMSRCSEMLDPVEIEDAPGTPNGLYL